MSRAHEESATKSKRVAASWKQKKELIAAKPGIASGGRCPAWLKGEKGQPFELIQERVAVVRKIYEMCLDGVGDFLIARYINERNLYWTPEGIHHSYVQKILTNRSVFGEYRPFGGGEPVPNHFPVVVDFATFKKAQELRAGRHRDGRGSTDPQLRNLFSGLIVDVTDGLPGIPVIFHNKRSELISDGYRHGLKPNRLKYANFEWAFLRLMDRMDWSSVLNLTESEAIQDAEKAISKLVADVASGEQDVKRLNDTLNQFPTKTLHERAVAAEAKLDGDKAALKSAEDHLEHLRKQNMELLSDDVIYAKLAESTDLQTRFRLRQEIRRKVDKIYLRWNLETGNCGGVVKFVNGAGRIIVFTGDEIIIATPTDLESVPADALEKLEHEEI